MPDPCTIVILKGNPDGTLKMSDNGYSPVDVGTRIDWIIADTANVASIEKVHKKKFFPVIFIGGPSRDGQRWTGKVVFSSDKDYDYYITWTEKGTGTTRTFDPKIAVRPNPITFPALVLLVAIVIMSIPAIRFFNRKRNSK